MDDNSNNPIKVKTKTLSVSQYFKITRNYIIRYPNLPCLHVGNINKKTAVPIEVNICLNIIFIIE